MRFLSIFSFRLSCLLKQTENRLLFNVYHSMCNCMLWPAKVATMQFNPILIIAILKLNFMIGFFAAVHVIKVNTLATDLWQCQIHYFLCHAS